MLFHCIYTSVETHPLASEEVTQIIEHSRKSNVKHNLTGVLLHVGNTFFQVLEGSAEELSELYDKILKDPRHTQITRIIFEAIPRRYFAGSSMSLTTMSPAELSTLLDSPDDDAKNLLLAGLDEGRAKKLLRAFSDGRWRSCPVSASRSEAQLA